MSRKIISLFLCLGFLFQQTGFAQVAAVELNVSGYLAKMGSGFIQDKFRPLHLRYFSYDNLNNNFKILLDKGDFEKTQGLSPKGTVPEDRLKEATRELLSYFLIGVTLPNDTFWVNLRPDSETQIIDSALAQTDIGKIMLEADLELKKDTAKYTSPQTPEGRQYWDKLYQKAGELFGSDNITIPTLTRPWIVPNEIIVRETQDSAYVYKATLKVMLEQDYLKDSATYNFQDERAKALNEYSSQLIRELIIPKLTKEVNISQRYAQLRQVYYSLILSRWFKSRFLGKAGVYASLIDKSDLTGLTSKENWSKTTYFKEYQKSFAEGEYNLKEPVYTPTGQVIRSYFSGGIALRGELNIPGASSPVAKIGAGIFSGFRNILAILVGAGYLAFAGVPAGNVGQSPLLTQLTPNTVVQSTISAASPVQANGATASSPVGASAQAEFSPFFNRFAEVVAQLRASEDGSVAVYYPDDYAPVSRPRTVAQVTLRSANSNLLEELRQLAVIERSRLAAMSVHQDRLIVTSVLPTKQGQFDLLLMFRDRPLVAQVERALLGSAQPQRGASSPVVMEGFLRGMKEGVSINIAESDRVAVRVSKKSAYHMDRDLFIKGVKDDKPFYILFKFEKKFIDKEGDVFSYNYNPEDNTRNVHAEVHYWDDFLDIFAAQVDERMGRIEIRVREGDINALKQIEEKNPGLSLVKISLGDKKFQSLEFVTEFSFASQNPKGAAASPVQVPETTGGIDLRALPMTAQPMGSFSGLNFNLPKLSKAELESINLDEEMRAIQNMIKAGIIPSGQRIKEFLAACFQKGQISKRWDDVLVCLVKICKLEEEAVCESTPELREALVIVELNK